MEGGNRKAGWCEAMVTPRNEPHGWGEKGRMDGVGIFYLPGMSDMDRGDRKGGLCGVMVSSRKEPVQVGRLEELMV